MTKMSKKMRVTDSNIEQVPKTSGVYILHRGTSSKYVGSAGAHKLQQRVKQQLNEKRGVSSFQFRPTTSEKEARGLEKKYRDRINPEQKRI